MLAVQFASHGCVAGKQLTCQFTASAKPFQLLTGTNEDHTTKRNLLRDS
jgi:hypothetical protein